MKPSFAFGEVSTNPFLALLLQVCHQPASQCLHRSAYPKALPGHTVTRNARRQFFTTSLHHKTLSPLPETARQAKVPTYIGLDRNPQSLSAISRIPIPNGERGEIFTPSTLARPLGLPTPPQPGQNVPIDRRSLSEKSRDFSDKDRALERRKKLLRSYLRPYFQEWKRVDHWKGKSFVANPLLFRRDAALYFPNMWGRTLSEEGDGLDKGRDTTPAFRGKITIVGIQSGQWAEEQVATFIGEQQNKELHDMIRAGKCQRADVNVQDNWLRALFVFESVLRKQVPREQWERYFLVRMARDVGRGLTEDIRDAMGFLNSNVGYVYLLDKDCRIRWAASGHAWPGERESLNAGVKRLHAEMTGEKVRREDALPIKIDMPKDVMGSPRVQSKQRRTIVTPA